jgi:hypothetical protein
MLGEAEMAFLFFSFWDRRLSRAEILWRRKKDRLCGRHGEGQCGKILSG